MGELVTLIDVISGKQAFPVKLTSWTTYRGLDDRTETLLRHG